MSNTSTTSNTVTISDPYGLNNIGATNGGSYYMSPVVPTSTTYSYPSSSVWTTVGTGTQVYGNSKYAVFELPRKLIPMAIYVCGRLVTVGVLGTDVECAYTGNRLVFEPGVINALGIQGRNTISLQYKDRTYHYNISDGGAIKFRPNSTILDAVLVSVVDHKK